MHAAQDWQKAIEAVARQGLRKDAAEDEVPGRDVGVRDAGGDPDDMDKDADGQSGFLVTEPNGQKHLPTRSGGKPDAALMGAAYAALTSNHRGQSYSGPDKQGTLERLKVLYRRLGMDLPSTEKTLCGLPLSYWKKSSSATRSPLFIAKQGFGSQLMKQVTPGGPFWAEW
jgi:hypothetical protein